MSGRVDSSNHPEASNSNLVATAAGYASLQSLKSARTTARGARTSLAYRFVAQRLVIRDREAEGVGEDDPESQALLEEEEACEEQYAYASAKFTIAELPYYVALVRARCPEQPVSPEQSAGDEDRRNFGVQALATPGMKDS
ncbi:hypothetical protein FOZ63_029785 [Perkinsus olseni]|uniref:Uncharacterized protein n=1 Tax=Perkinsus olseni TaxID=32597 RepID=A0A7J6UMQ2_PEROL|nr:hypothetical protein FOZ63_029785 [Perkinsus olseni]